MKTWIFIALVAFFAGINGVFVPPRPGHQKHLLGAKECTWGPSYWCQNLTSAAGCHAVKHCIQNAWIHKTLPPDYSSVCQTCLDMVKQARDQLESNETQELIKQVFEGSCALLHVKPVVKECDKIADQYIPELVDTLASEMNPQVVCSVAGLCNNEKIHLMLIEAGEEIPEEQTGGDTERDDDTCTGCHTVLTILEEKFNKMTPDQVLQSFLQVCGRAGSFSDACSNIVITYFSHIYKHLQENFNAHDVCLLSGECHTLFHTHEEKIQITPMSHVGYIKVTPAPTTVAPDDLPCKFCEQLVQHLRDLLVANTTEDEFKKVLEGLCKQSGSFQKECLDLVEQFYQYAYNMLVNELKPNEVCEMLTICPKNSDSLEVAPLMPLLPVESADGKLLEITPAPKRKPIRVNMAQDGAAVKIYQTPEESQLPIDVLMNPHSEILYNQEKCVFCEYFLHYVQEVITSPKTEDEIKAIIDGACEKLPSSVNQTCVQFVNLYEPALVAILAQEIDPSQVCPLLKICPSPKVKDVEIFIHQDSDGSKCPLCLFAVSRLEQMVKDHKTEENIKAALTSLCSKLSDNLKEECNDFVNTYTDELVEMLIADLNPQEVCVYLKLCTSSAVQTLDRKPTGNTDTNAISDNTVNGKPLEVEDTPQCVMCEFVMKTLQDDLKDKTTDEEIKAAVEKVCSILPKSVKTECDGFIDQYGQTIINLLIAATKPDEICRMMKLCAGTRLRTDVQVEIFDCAICESLVYAMEKILSNPKVDHNVEHVLEKACRALPRKEQKKCKDIVDKYGKTIFDLIIHQTSKHLICKEIGLCKSNAARPTAPIRKNGLVGSEKCTWGPGYWCASEKNAAECGDSARKHCQEKVWNSKTKRDVEQKLVGSNPCTRGPGYWCQTEKHAQECGDGAIKHCKEKVWNSKTKRDVEQKPVGGEKCTWGPAHWCESKENAQACGIGAVTHCQEKVWLAKEPKP